MPVRTFNAYSSSEPAVTRNSLLHAAEFMWPDVAALLQDFAKIPGVQVTQTTTTGYGGPGPRR